jgi:hypothetical protein
MVADQESRIVANVYTLAKYESSKSLPKMFADLAKHIDQEGYNGLQLEGY